jgi:putative ATP-dependent endonuclease of the OLD family
MRVKSVTIENFRGIQYTRLENCGRLNVLIGKNNSGKSTILDAMNLFFTVLRGDGVVQLDGPLSIATNFRRGAPNETIRITVELTLLESELLAIVDDVASEAPQLKHALENIATSSSLFVTVVGTNDSQPYAHVERVVLADLERDGQSEKVLLEIPTAAARELQEKVREGGRSTRTATDIERISANLDSEDFARYKNRDRSLPRAFITQSLTRAVGRGTADRDAVFQVERLIKESEDFNEFRQRLDPVVQTALESARRIQNDQLKTPIITFAGEALSVPEHVTKILSRVAKHSCLHLRDRRAPVGREEARRLLALKVRRGGPEILRNIQETVQSLMGVAIDAFESSEPTVGVSSRGDEARAEMDVDEVLVEMNGAGIREALRLVLDNELTNPDLLLVEEPEIHLHPALEMSMLRYLQAASDHSQIFVTTHSTNFLDTSDMRNVYLISREPWVEARLLDYAEAEEAIPAQLGLRLSSLFMFDRLVFVEGPSDEAVLRELASTIGVNLGRAGVGFVSIGGARNFTHYATESTLRFLTKRRVDMMFVLDRDESSDEEIARLQTFMGSSAILHMLERREMENYLAVPRPLAEFIKWKRDLSGLPVIDVSPDAISETLQEVAGELRDTFVNRRLVRSFCKPVYPSRERLLQSSETGSLEERLNEEVQRLGQEVQERSDQLRATLEVEYLKVDQQWASDKLKLVPGDELLDGVCKRYDVRFRKDRDAQRLASLVEANEIARDLVSLLNRLVRG